MKKKLYILDSSKNNFFLIVSPMLIFFFINPFPSVDNLTGYLNLGLVSSHPNHTFLDEVNSFRIQLLLVFFNRIVKCKIYW